MAKPEMYMQRALNLARLGAGFVSPNPMVGCVIVKNDKIIGEGWHQKYGEAHAEVNAINSVIDQEQLSGAEMYVSLEPCSHYGKTPPCANLIIQYPFKKVYIAQLDYNPLVSGRGVEIIKQKGIDVAIGLMGHEATELNKRFFFHFKSKRPYVILKWAETANGFMAPITEDKYWISNSYSKTIVHKWRTEEDAIMIGTNTANLDNPALTVRDWSGRNPIRILIDKKLTVNVAFKILQDHPTIVYNTLKNETLGSIEYVKIDDDENFLKNLFLDMWNRKIQSVIIEGGKKLLENVIKINSWDEARVFSSSDSWVNGLKSPELNNAEIIDQIKIDNDLLTYYKAQAKFE